MQGFIGHADFRKHDALKVLVHGSDQVCMLQEGIKAEEDSLYIEFQAPAAQINQCVMSDEKVTEVTVVSFGDANEGTLGERKVKFKQNLIKNFKKLDT